MSIFWNIVDFMDYQISNIRYFFSFLDVLLFLEKNKVIFSFSQKKTDTVLACLKKFQFASFCFQLCVLYLMCLHIPILRLFQILYTKYEATVPNKFCYFMDFCIYISRYLDQVKPQEKSMNFFK